MVLIEIQKVFLNFGIPDGIFTHDFFSLILALNRKCYVINCRPLNELFFCQSLLILGLNAQAPQSYWHGGGTQ